MNTGIDNILLILLSFWILYTLAEEWGCIVLSDTTSLESFPCDWQLYNVSFLEMLCVKRQDFFPCEKEECQPATR